MSKLVVLPHIRKVVILYIERQKINIRFILVVIALELKELRYD
jgi:hypothetical protein